MKNILIATVCCLFLTGCYETTSHYQLQDQIRYSASVTSNVSLGQSRSQVLNILLPAENNLNPMFGKKQAEQYVKDGKNYYIHFHRTGWVSDGRSTDDEFTPYVFENDKLIAIGWSHLGGAEIVSSGNVGMGGVVTINDPVRDSNALMQQGQKMLSGGCTLGINC